MTIPLKSPAGELPAHMDDTPSPSTAHPHTAAGPAPAGEPPAGGEDPRPEAPPLTASQAPDPAKLSRRTVAGAGSVASIAMLVGIVTACLGVLGTAVGFPLYLMDGNIRELGVGIEALEDDLKELKDGIDARFVEIDAKFDAKLAALEDKMDARFVEQDAKFDAKLAALEDKMDARFVEQDAKFDAKLAALEDKMDARFVEQDAKFDAKFAALERGQAEIDRKLTALIAHLNQTGAVEAALEGRIES